MLKDTKTRSYLVPVLMHTLDILELLLKSDHPLKTRYISNTTGVSQRTTDRILQTLADRGYLAQDLEGKFSLLNRSKSGSITGWLKRMSTNVNKSDRPADQPTSMPSA